MNKTFVFVGLLALCAMANAEFLFEKNIAADDKFMCLHKKLYRNEKPPVVLNAARILSMKRNLQSLQSDTDSTNLRNYICEGSRLSFGYRGTFCDLLTQKLASKKNTLYFKSDEYKQMVVESANFVFKTKQTLGEDTTTANLEKDAYLEDIATEVKKRLDNMMNTQLGAHNVKLAAMDGIANERIVYIMLNILHLFKEDGKTAREAYEYYYSSNKGQLTGSAFNSEAVIRWIESIKKRYIAIKTEGDPDRETILEPFTETGAEAPETPAGSFVEPVPTVQTPNPKDLEEEEPKTVEVPKTNEDIIIKDMLIEIQRTYNVEKMLLTYHQLTNSLKEDILSCKLNLNAALARCEKSYGVGQCEAFGPTMVTRKCPVGFSREGCCRCVVDCPDSEYFTTSRSICEMKTDLHYIAELSNVQTQEFSVATRMAVFAKPCKDGYESSPGGLVCYKRCPAGTVAIGASSCLKLPASSLGAPFQWTAGDE